jgi:cyanophycinase
MPIEKIILVLFISVQSLFSQGYLCAVGGGREDYRDWSDAPYRWMVQQADSGQTLVMHYSDGSTWLENYFKSFGARSASSLVISSRSAANDSAHYRTILQANHVFLRGGDQSRYYTLWKGTLVEDALRLLYQRGGVIGGTSAGLAVLGGVDYVALRGSAVSRDCLLNPQHPDITLSDDFLPLCPDVLFDSHFTARARLGRLLAFTAQWNQDHHADLLGIGVDEHTALCIDPEGTATVMGAGSVTLVSKNPESLVRNEWGSGLFLTDWNLDLLIAGFSYDLRQRRVVGFPESAHAPSPATGQRSPEATCTFFGSLEKATLKTELESWLQSTGNDSLLLFTGAESSVTQSILQELGVEQLKPITLNSDINVSAVFERMNRLVISDWTPEQQQALLMNHPEFLTALQKTLNSPKKIFLAGTSTTLTTSLWIPNLTEHRYHLQNGRLSAVKGMESWHPALLMPNAFETDDYDENRMGGLFWLLCKQPGSLAMMVDDRAGFTLNMNRLSVNTSMPVILIDGRSVTLIDASEYRYRPSYPTRQSVALIGARLWSLVPDSAAAFDLQTGTWQQSTGVEVRTGSTLQPEGHTRLYVYPNPATNRVFIECSRPPSEPGVHMRIYNVVGRLVTRLAPAKENTWIWHPDRATISSGVYFGVLDDRDQRWVQSFLLH